MVARSVIFSTSPDASSGPDHIAHVILVLDENEHTSQDVLDQRLSAEADGQSRHADAGQYRSDVDSELLQDHQNRRAPHGHPDDVAHDLPESRGLLLAFVHRRGIVVVEGPLDPSYDEGRKPHDNEGSHDYRKRPQASCRQPSHEVLDLEELIPAHRHANLRGVPLDRELAVLVDYLAVGVDLAAVAHVVDDVPVNAGLVRVRRTRGATLRAPCGTCRRSSRRTACSS